MPRRRLSSECLLGFLSFLPTPADMYEQLLFPGPAECRALHLLLAGAAECGAQVGSLQHACHALVLCSEEGSGQGAGVC